MNDRDLKIFAVTAAKLASETFSPQAVEQIIASAKKDMSVADNVKDEIGKRLIAIADARREALDIFAAAGHEVASRDSFGISSLIENLRLAGAEITPSREIAAEAPRRSAMGTTRRPGKKGAPAAIKTAPEKIEAVIGALVAAGIGPRDFQITPYEKPEKKRKKESAKRTKNSVIEPPVYYVITVKSLGKQIRVSDIVGEGTLVSQSILPFEVWGTDRKHQLEMNNDVISFRYGEKNWLDKIVACLHGKVDPERRARALAPRVDKDWLSVGILQRWIEVFYDEKGRYPTIGDKEVWDEDSKTGRRFVVEGENWEAIDQNIASGYRGLEAIKGMTLYTFRKAHGLHDDWSEERLIDSLKLFHENENGQYPRHREQTVWGRNRQGEAVVLLGENWPAIYKNLREGTRGLEKLKGTILGQFIKQKIAEGVLSPPVSKADLKAKRAVADPFPS